MNHVLKMAELEEAAKKLPSGFQVRTYNGASLIQKLANEERARQAAKEAK